MRQTLIAWLLLFVPIVPLMSACGNGTAETPSPPPLAETDETPDSIPTGNGDLQVALVTDLGRVNDGTFNEFAHMGVVQAQEEFGFLYRYIETQAMADYTANIQTFIDEQYDVIVTVGFLIQDETLAAARANPEIIFIGVDQFYAGDDVLPNLIGLQFREDQAGFLAGAMAGMMTRSGTVGVVAGEEIPPVKRFRNGFNNGARYVNPDVNLVGTYVPSFINSALGISTAEQFIGEGADVIFGAGGPMGSAAIRAAAEAGVYVIGVDQDEYNTTFGRGATPGADRILTSAIKRVDVAVYDQIRAVVEGTFESTGIVVYEAANGGIGYADFHDAAAVIPEAVQQRMAEILQMLVDETLTTGVDPVSGDLDPATIPDPVPFEA